MKKKALPNMRPRAAKMLPATDKAKGPYRLLVGSPTGTSMIAEEFETAEQAKKRARKVFSDWLPWCERYNKAGTANLHKALDEVDLYLGIGYEPHVVEAIFDDLTNMVARVTLWKELPGGSKKQA